MAQRPLKLNRTGVASLRLMCDIASAEKEARARSGKETMRMKRKSGGYTQDVFEFDPRQLRMLLKEEIGIDEKDMKTMPLVTFAGYIGKFSEALKKAGFTVVHTDILPEWVRAGHRKGVFAAKAASSKLPEFRKTLAYVCFEGWQAFKSKVTERFVDEAHPDHVKFWRRGGFDLKEDAFPNILPFLHTIGKSKHGLIFVEVIHPRNLPENRDFRDLVVKFIGKYPGVKAEARRVGLVNAINLFATDEITRKILNLDEAVALDIGSRKKRITHLDVAEEAEKHKVSEEEIIESLKRLELS